MKNPTSKAEAKFERVMHEFGQNTLTSHDKPVTDKRQALAIAFGEARKVNPNYGVKGMMKEGGIAGNELQKIYETGTSKQLWEAWNTDQRTHFIIDHSGEFFELMDEDFNKSAKAFIALSYDTLPKPIRKSLIIHHAMGMYNNGGIIKNENDFEPGTPAVYHSMGGYPNRHLEQSGEIVIRNGKKGISLYPDENYSGSEERFVIPKNWNNVENYYEANKRREKNKKFVIKMNDGAIIGDDTRKVYIDVNRRKYVLIDTTTIKPWANEFFDTDKEAKSFAKQNSLEIVQRIDTGDVVKWAGHEGAYGVINTYNGQAKFKKIGEEDKESYGAPLDELTLVQAAPDRRGMLSNGGPITNKLSPAKKQLQDRINTLKATKASAGEAAQKSIQKKIDKLQAELDYNPSAKQKVKDNQGKFALDVPEEHSKYIYKKLWSMNILPKVVTLGDKASIVVNSQINLEKAYDVYSDRMKDKKQKPLPISKISRKL